MITLTKSTLRKVLEILLMAGICYFPLCYNIDALAIRQWDEARNAVHTVEMRNNHNFIVRHFEGIPETWEPKPPLLIWLQVASSGIFGLNEFAIRFPAMLASILTVVLLVFYFHRFHGNRYIGYLASLVLITSQGYIDRHIARTGDHDALLILFLTAILLIFYRYLTSSKPRPVLIISMGVLFILSVYTKSAAFIIIVPGLLASIFIFGAAKKLFTDKWLYFTIFLFITATGSYYVVREIMQPGYLEAVWHWELFPRYANTENRFDSGTFWYYAINFYKSRFTWWLWILIPAVLMLPFLLKNEIRRFYYYILINCLLLFIMISSGSKGLWYDGPLYPLFAVIIGVFLMTVYKLCMPLMRMSSKIIYLLSFLLLLAVFFIPYRDIVKKNNRTSEYPWDLEIYNMSYVLRDHKTLEKLPDPLKIVFDGYYAHLLFYVKAENHRLGRERLQLVNYKKVNSDDTILLSQPQLLDSIKTLYPYEIIRDKDHVKLVHIKPCESFQE